MKFDFSKIEIASICIYQIKNIFRGHLSMDTIP